MKNKVISWVIVLGMTGFVFNLVQPEDKPDAVLEKIYPDFAEKKPIITAKAYTSLESEELFGKDLLERGFTPIEITIDNPTSNTYYLTLNEISLDMASPNQIAKSVRKGSLPRSLGLKLASFIFWPMMIPSTIDSINTHTSYKSLESALKEHMLDNEIIEPKESIKKFIYSLEGSSKAFTVSLIDKESNQPAIFEVS